MIGYKYRSGRGPRSANWDNGYAIVFDTDILYKSLNGGSRFSGIYEFDDKGSCSIGSGEKVFVLDWEGVNDWMVRVGSEQAERNCINPDFVHLPTEAELEVFTVEAQSWSIPEGGVFVLFGKQGTAAVRLLHTRKGADGYTVELEYRIY